MKKQKTQRILLLFVVMAVCMCMITNSVAASVITSDMALRNAVVSVDENTEIKVTNGGFETGTIDGWSVEPGHDSNTLATWANAVSVTTEEKHSGNNSAKVIKSSADGYYSYQTIIYSPEVGKNYTISYWAKTTDTAKVGSVFLAQGDESTNWATYDQLWNNGEEHFITASGEWEQRSYTFSLSDNDDIKMISIRLMIYGQGTAYLDDIEISEKSTSGENLFSNGDFNTNSNGWSIGMSTEIPPEPTVVDCGFTNGDFETVIQDVGGNDVFFGYNLGGAAEISTANVHSGTYSAKYNSGFFTNYETSVEPGTYKLSMWVNIVSGDTVEMSGYVTGCGIAWQDYAMTAVRGVTDGWVQTSGEITFTEAGKPQFGFKSYDGSGEVYIDDITLTKEYFEPLTTTTELLKNNNFADGNANWSFSGNSEIIDDNGTNEIKMTVPANGSEYIQQTVAVVPGKTYDFSADLMTQEQDGNDAQAQVYVIDSAWNMVCPSEYKTYGWKHLTAKYTAPAGVTSVTVLLQHNVVAGVSFWKNISFSITETVTEEQRENVFVNGDFETTFASDSSYAYNINDAVAEFTTETVHSGTYAAKYTSGYFTNYGTSVEPGTYTLSMWVNTVSGSTVEMSGYVTGCGIDWKDFAMTAVRGVTDGWVQISGEVTFTEAGTPQFGFKSYDGSGEVYIDDIKLEKVTYIPVYPSSDYTEGVGNFGKDGSNCLKVDTTTEFWNYGTSVTAGQKYIYSMDIKIEDSEEGFQFRPYVYNFGDSWQQSTVYNSDTDWTHYVYEFTAGTPDPENGTRFGFVRSGTGTVFIDNVELYTVPDEVIPPISSENENLLTGTSRVAQKDSTNQASISNIVAGKKYILKFNVACLSDKDDAIISAKLGTAGFEDLIISQTDSFVAVSAVVTAQESGSVDLVLGSKNTNSIFDDIELYREYSLGDVNGDDSINLIDLVRYKKYLADNSNKLVTYIYADIDNNNLLDSGDLAELVNILIG